MAILISLRYPPPLAPSPHPPSQTTSSLYNTHSPSSTSSSATPPPLPFSPLSLPFPTSSSTPFTFLDCLQHLCSVYRKLK